MVPDPAVSVNSAGSCSRGSSSSSSCSRGSSRYVLTQGRSIKKRTQTRYIYERCIGLLVWKMTDQTMVKSCSWVCKGNEQVSCKQLFVQVLRRGAASRFRDLRSKDKNSRATTLHLLYLQA